MVARADERDVQFDRWFAVQTNLQSWSADFTQTRSLKVLSQPLVATGKVWVTVPNRFRWELGQPAQTIVLRQPDQLLIIYPRLKRAEKYSLSGVPPGPLKDALALMDASLPRDRATMEESFRLLSATETNSILQMTLRPQIYQRNSDRLSHQQFLDRSYRVEIRRRLQPAQRFYQYGAQPAD